MVRPTRFDKKYSLIRETNTKTSTGGTSGVKSVLYEDWCNKKPVNGVKRIDYSSMNYSNPFTLTVRKRADYTILDSDQIRLNSIDYQIVSLYETEDEMYVIIDVSK